jgi:hypothetical protein
MKEGDQRLRKSPSEGYAATTQKHVGADVPSAGAPSNGALFAT